MSLHDELCRVFNMRGHALDCLLRHGQLTIDGFIIRREHLRRWPPDRLRGRTARLSSAGTVFREAKLYA